LLQIKTMLVFIKKYRLTIIGIALGSIAGYLYWRNIGCSSGTCLITSKPVNATLYGALMGGLIFSMFTTKKIKSDQDDKHN
jgi:Family of unknown function (DUF6132)